MSLTACEDCGSVLSEVQHSGYEDVEEELLLEKSVIVDQAEYYDDVTTTGCLISDMTTEDTPDNYDDVITAGHNSDIVEGSVLSEVQHSGYEDVEEELLSGDMTTEDTPENYDDVITTGHNPVADDGSENYDDVITADQTSVDVTEVMTENYDDVIINGLNPDIIAMDTPEDSDDVISAGQDVGDVDDYEDIKEEPEKEMNHVTERPRPMPFFRKLHLNFFKLKK
ncbi:uncharacterized protein LOC143513748 [Brachyhypopomus gauderio]|uniref:uncharacterized protein LOC143513748 n=1 Tax=Brachyhypopomus gauderio TaxID=698409 RepID=UPI00404389B2